MPFTSRGVLLAAWLVLFCPLYRGRGRAPRGAGEGWGYLGGLGAGQPRLPRGLVMLAAGAAVELVRVADPKSGLLLYILSFCPLDGWEVQLLYVLFFLLAR